MVKIVTDSTSTLSAAAARQYDIPVLPQIIHFADGSFLEGIEIDIPTFMERLKAARELPRTSAPPPELFVEEFRRLVPLGEPIICIHPTAEASGTIRSVTVARQEFPDADIRIIDTRITGSPMATMAVLAAQWAAAGVDAGIPVDTFYDCPAELAVNGSSVVNYAGSPDGSMNMDTALTFSVNTYFAQLALALGGDLVDYAQRFGMQYEQAHGEIELLADAAPAFEPADDVSVVGIPGGIDEGRGTKPGAESPDGPGVGPIDVRGGGHRPDIVLPLVVVAVGAVVAYSQLDEVERQLRRVGLGVRGRRDRRAGGLPGLRL